jgi:hypothetical protein
MTRQDQRRRLCRYVCGLSTSKIPKVCAGVSPFSSFDRVETCDDRIERVWMLVEVRPKVLKIFLDLLRNSSLSRVVQSLCRYVCGLSTPNIPKVSAGVSPFSSFDRVETCDDRIERVWMLVEVRPLRKSMLDRFQLWGNALCRIQIMQSERKLRRHLAFDSVRSPGNP